MADEAESLVLEHLRAIRATLEKHSQAFADISLRLSGIEQHMAGFQLSEVRQNSAIDQLTKRVERIEKRLELVDED